MGIDTSDVIDVLQLSYENVQKVRNVNMAIIQSGQLYGLYDLEKQVVILPVTYKRFRFHGPVITFSTSYIENNATLYCKYSNKIIEVPDGIAFTRVIGASKVFGSNQRRLIAVRRNNGSIALDIKYKNIHFADEKVPNKSAVHILDEINKVHVLMQNGHVNTLNKYLSEAYKEVYIMDTDDSINLIGIDNSLCGYQLGSDGSTLKFLGKVRNLDTIRRLERYI